MMAAAADKISCFISGCSRGLGLELVRQLTSNPDYVVLAGCRLPETADALMDMREAMRDGRLHIVRLDVIDEASIITAAMEAKRLLGDNGLDILLNNAAINTGDDLAFDFNEDKFLKTLQSNVIGPALMSRHFRPLLEKGNKKMLIHMSSGLGGLGRDMGAIHSTYSISKSALNMLTYKQASETPELITIAMCPGWCRTDMGGEDAALDPKFSVKNMIKFFESVTREHSGYFYNYDGSRSPW